MIKIHKTCPKCIRIKIKGLIIIILSEPRNDYNHTSGVFPLGHCLCGGSRQHLGVRVVM